MATTKKRVVSLLMALVMALSLLPTIAFASDTQIQEEKQIMEGYYQADDTNQAVTETVVNQEQNSSAGGNVKVSKTIAATGTENVFEITLEVQTKQKLSETATSPDAAIVLVMDRSGSMKYCAECGKNSIERETESKYYCNGTSGKEFEGKNWKRCENCGKWLSEHNAVEVVTESCNRQGCDSTQSRLTAAKAGAIDFMNQLLEDTAKNADGSYTAHRYISVASFAARSSTSLDCDWVDITTTDGYNAAVAAVNGLEANGGTYLQGGLQRAVNQMGKTNAINGTVDITKVANRYTVVLTDGKPTYSKDYGNGSSCSENICNQTAGTAAELKKLSSVYSICYGADSETCYGDVTVGDFLGRISSAYYSADNISELNTAFGNISDLIALLTEAWKVTDPMGELHKVMIKPLPAAGAQLLSGACGNKHAHSSFLVEQSRVHQEIDALQSGGGIDLVIHRVLGDGGHLLLLGVGAGEDGVLQPLRQLEEDRPLIVEFHGLLLSLVH